MTDVWDRDTVLGAVRAAVQRLRAGDDDVPARVELDGDDVLVTFSWPDEPHLFGVRFPLNEAPQGPSTGGVCESPEEWAWEVSLVLMEELDTGLVRRGRRITTPRGLVELDYRPTVDSPDPAASPGPPPPGHHYRVVALPEAPTAEAEGHR